MEEKKRTAFTVQEKEVLKELIMKHKIVVNKNTDGATLQKKNQAWIEIQDEFNSMGSHSMRTIKQLKKLWDNIKTEKKKKLASLKREVMSTGGGPPPKPPTDDPSDFLLTTFSTEIEGAVDSDTVAMSKVETTEPVSGHDEFLAEHSISEGDCTLVVTAIEDVGCSSRSENKLASASSSTLEYEKEGSSTFSEIKPKIMSQSTQKRKYIASEASERVKRVKMQINNDESVHSLLMKELENKYALSLMFVKAQEEEMKRNAELHALSLQIKEEELKKIKLEVKLLEKKFN